MATIGNTELLDLVCGAKNIKLYAFLKFYQVEHKESDIEDDIKSHHLFITEDLYAFAFLSTALTSKMRILGNDACTFRIILDTWELVELLYRGDDQCEFCKHDLIQMLVDKVIL